MENHGFLTIGKEGSTTTIGNRGSIPSTSQGFTSRDNDEQRSTPIKDRESTSSEGYQNSELTEDDEESSMTHAQMHSVSRQLSILVRIDLFLFFF